MKTALIIVDVQNDFCEGGSLEVPNANKIIPKINALRELKIFDLIILSRDWHPSDHISFCKNHPGRDLFSSIQIQTFDPNENPTKYSQTLWPEHCVQNTIGAEYHPNLITAKSDYEIFKGQNKLIESYSAFGSHGEDTGLDSLLKENKIDSIFCCGLAYDICVGETALSGAKLGYQTYLIADASKGVTQDGIEKMNVRLESENVSIVQTMNLESLEFEKHHKLFSIPSLNKVQLKWA